MKDEMIDICMELEKIITRVHNPYEFLMIMGTIFDYWTDRNGYSVEESKGMMEILLNAHSQVNDTIGTFSQQAMKGAE